MSNVIMFGEICILDCRKNVYSFIIKNQSFIKKSMFKYNLFLFWGVGYGIWGVKIQEGAK